MNTVENTNRPTIIIVTHVIPFPPAAGNEIRILKMISWLKQQGFAVILLLKARELRPQVRTSLEEIVAAIHLIEDDYELGQATCVSPDREEPAERSCHLDPQKQRSVEVERSLAPRRLIQITQHLCERYKPCAVIAEYIFTAPCLDVVPEGVLKIIDTHDMFSRKEEQVLAYGIDDPLPCTPEEERNYLLKGDLIVAIQSNEARLFSELVREREVITIGIDFKVVSKVDNSAVRQGTILVVGSDNPLNIHGLRQFYSRSWPAVRAQCPGAVLRVVGKLAKHLQTDDHRVELVGWVPDLKEEYRQAAVVLNSTVAGTGLKIKSVEALCEAKALVGTPSSVEGLEYSGQAPYIVCHDWDVFSDTLVTLLSCEEKRLVLQERALEFAKAHFSTDQVYAPLGEKLAPFLAQRHGGNQRNSMKLRIAVWHNLPSGGGKRQLYNHVKGLVGQGHYVESWCPDTADQKYLPLNEIITEHVIPLNRMHQGFTHAVRPFPVVKDLLQVMENHCRSCAEEIDRGDFDLLFANACMFLRAPPIAKFVKLPSCVYLGEPYRWFYEAMPELPWIAPKDSPAPKYSLSWLRDLLHRKAILQGVRTQARAELEYAKEFDLILVNSVFSRETVLRTYNLESKVCYLGIDGNYYKPTGEPKEGFVVGLGTIYHAKGVDRAIRAIGTIEKKKRPNLIWIGNGASEASLNAYKVLAKQLEVDFILKIHIDDQEVISLLSRAAAMIYTSRLEPFGLAPLEANACGTAVVGIAEGGVRETVSEGMNGFLAQDDDPVELGRLVEKVIDDARASNEMGSKARKHVIERWSIESCTKNIESMLYSLSKEKRVKKILSDQRLLREIQPSGDMRMNLDELSIENSRLRARGWAFINDGVDTSESSIYLFLKRGTEVQLVPMAKHHRPDVTEYFGNQVNYDNSGFSVEAPIEPLGISAKGVVIIRNDKISLQYFD